MDTHDQCLLQPTDVVCDLDILLDIELMVSFTQLVLQLTSSPVSCMYCLPLCAVIADVVNGTRRLHVSWSVVGQFTDS